VQIGRNAYRPKSAKVGHKGRGQRHVTYFYNFGIPSISLEWNARDFKFGISKMVTDMMLGSIEVE